MLSMIAYLRNPKEINRILVKIKKPNKFWMIIKFKVLKSPFFILGNFDPFRLFETNVFLYCVITNHLKTNIDLKENHSYIYMKYTYFKYSGKANCSQM